MEKRKKLGTILIEAGLINHGQLVRALKFKSQRGGKLGSVLVSLRILREEDIASALEKQLGYPYVSLKNREIPERVLNSIKAEVAQKFSIVPIDIDENSITVAMVDPTDLGILDALYFAIGKRVKPAIAVGSEIQGAITKYYCKGARNVKTAPEKPEFVGRDGEPCDMPDIKF